MSQTKKSAFPYKPLVVGLSAAAFLILCGVALQSATMGPLEKSIFTTLYDASDQLGIFALLITQLGNAWVLIAIVGLLFVLKWRPEPALTVLRAGLLSYILATVAKVLVGRPRPPLLLEEVISREIVVRGFGFPSGHVALATAVSLALLPYLPKRLWWLPVPWIILVAWSRLYLGVHTPLDVLAGFCLGVFVAAASTYIPVEKFAKR
ncbi:MAG TPA: phosphatase PAP2 family protein [Verrucomicrobiae bacterium]|nr:phosphatase PAP2 family protein [Verrucomicrobiae bacterium]